jgi:hypothetical protein
LLLEVLEGDPDSSNAAALLLSLPKGFVSSEKLEEIARQNMTFEDEELFPERRLFFVADLYKRLGRHHEAFDNYKQANEAVYARSTLQVSAQETWQEQSLTHAKKSPNVPGHSDEEQPTSLFILGPSRSGKTSIETVLGNSKSVRLGYENPSFRNALHETFSAAGFVSSYQLDLLPKPLHAAFLGRYLTYISAQAGDKRIFTDTSPLNIHNALAISHIIPNAKFIFVKRDRIDTAVRIFQTYYNSGNLYAYSAKSALRHVDWYNAMIEICAEKLGPGAIVVDHVTFCQSPNTDIARIEALLQVELNLSVPAAHMTDSREASNYRVMFLEVVNT